MNKYLPCLQARQKWSKPQRNFEVGDIVLVVDESTSRSLWPLGRVVDVLRNSKDGYVRRVLIRTKSTVLQRPISKIVLLEELQPDKYHHIFSKDLLILTFIYIYIVVSFISLSYIERLTLGSNL